MKLKNVFLLLGLSRLMFANVSEENSLVDAQLQENRNIQEHGVSKPASSKQASTSKKQQNKKASSKKKAERKTTTAMPQVPSTAFTINKIVVSIYTEEDSAIITMLDLERPTLQGEKRSLEDMIFEMLVFLDAKAHKVVPDEEAIDRYLRNVQRENNLTLDQLKMIFEASGYSYEEGRHQFMVMSTVNSMIDYKIRSRLIVPEKDIVAYYEAHPEMEEPRYYVEIAYVSSDSEYVQGKIPDDMWGDPFWINKSELAEDKEFITQLKKGQTSEPYETAGGFEIYRLKDVQGERLKSLEARYKEISENLRRPRFEQLMAEYKKELFDTASIVYH